jgi:hypothetical protein
MIQSKSKALILLSVIFLLGILAGISLDSMIFKKSRGRGGDFRGPRKERIVEHFQSRLHLTPDQVKQLRTVLDDTDRQIEQLYQPLQSQHDAIFNGLRERTRAFLNDEQKLEYEKMIKEMDQRRRGGQQGGPGPGKPSQDNPEKSQPRHVDN